MRQTNLRDAATDAVFDQLFMTFSACFAVKNLRDHLAIFIIAVGINRRNSANATGSSPCARTCVIGSGNALATFDQRPNFAATIDNGFQTLEHNHNP